jgi:hypothetical protein
MHRPQLAGTRVATWIDELSGVRERNATQLREDALEAHVRSGQQAPLSGGDRGGCRRRHARTFALVIA